MNKCFFSDMESKVTTLDNRDGISVKTKELATYWIAGESVRAYISDHKLSPKDNFLCLQESIKLNREGLIPFWTIHSEDFEISENQKVVIRSIEKFKNREIDHGNKENKILQLLGEKLITEINPFEALQLSLSDRYLLGIFSETEIINWILHLHDEQLITVSMEFQRMISNRDRFSEQEFINYISKQKSITLSIKGWNLVHKMSESEHSRKAFIAMAFTDKNGAPVSSNLRDTIRTAIEECGWIPVIVDEVQHNDGVMDKIISLINESKFVIAELTNHKLGVYYEAGYAKGKNLQVIHLVKNDDLENCHFDVKHLNLIIWKTLDELAIRLKNRIKSTII